MATIAAGQQRLRRPRPEAASPAAVSRPSVVEQLQRRPAARTGDRLGVKPPVGRIVVLGPAVGAHRKRGHRGPRPVVGQLLDDRPARAAVRAIGERDSGSGVATDRGFRPDTRGTWPDRRESSAAAPTRSSLAVNLERLGPTSSPSMATAGRSPRLRRRRCGPGADERGEAHRRNASSAARSPCTSIRTVSASLRTQPVSPRARAAL